MRLRDTLGFLCLAVPGAAFGLAGGYERVYFWKVRQLEEALGIDIKILSSCPKPCSFQNFIKKVAREEKDFKGLERDTIEGTARVIEDAKATGEVDALKVMGRKIPEYHNFITEFSSIAQDRVEQAVEKQATLEKEAAKIKETLKGKTTKSQAKEAEKLKEEVKKLETEAEKLKKLNKDIHLAAESTFIERNQARYMNFRPFKDYRVKPDKTGKGIDFEATIKENDGGIPKAELEKLWENHLNGRQASEEMVKTFKPHQDFGYLLKDNNMEVDTKNWVKENTWLKEKGVLPWISQKWHAYKNDNHAKNIEAFEKAVANFNTVLCPATRRRVKRAAGATCRPVQVKDFDPKDAGVDGPDEVDKQGATKDPKEAANDPDKATKDPKEAPKDPKEATQDPKGEAPKDPNGEAPKEPRPREGKAGELGGEANLAEAAGKAERVSGAEFAQLAAKFQVGQVPAAWKSKGINTLSDVRSKVLSYKAVTPASPQLKTGFKGALSRFSGRAGGALRVMSAMLNPNDTTGAEVVASMVPFAGCAIDMYKHRNNVPGLKADWESMTDHMCLLGDLLLMSPLHFAGYLVHGVATVMSLVRMPEKVPGVDEGVRMRNVLWEANLRDELYPYLYSHPDKHPKEKSGKQSEQGFGDNMKDSLAVAKYATLSSAAQTIGLLDASTGIEANASSPEIRQAQDLVRNGTADEIGRSQRRVLLGAVASFTNETVDESHTLAAYINHTNTDFSKWLQGEENLEKYSLNEFGHTLSGIRYCSYLTPCKDPPPRQERFAHARRLLSNLTEQVVKRPVKMPRTDVFAWMLGQSYGLADLKLDDPALSPQAYIGQVVQDKLNKTAPKEYLDRLAILHSVDTLAVMGQVEAPRGATLFPPVQDVQKHVIELRALITIKYGRLAEEDRKRGGGKILTREQVTTYSKNQTSPIPFDFSKGEVRGAVVGSILNLGRDVDKSEWSSEARNKLTTETRNFKAVS